MNIFDIITLGLYNFKAGIKGMSIEYKINVLAELKAKGYNTTRLRREKILGEATLQRLRHNKSVSYEVLSKLCGLLECDLSDILEYRKDD